jgi:transposase
MPASSRRRFCFTYFDHGRSDKMPAGVSRITAVIDRQAVRRPSMRFVPVKAAHQQSAAMMHRAQDLLIRQRTVLVNALRGHLAEFGLIKARGLHKVTRLIAIVMDDTDKNIHRHGSQRLQIRTYSVAAESMPRRSG